MALCLTEYTSPVFQADALLRLHLVVLEMYESAKIQ